MNEDLLRRKKLPFLREKIAGKREDRFHVDVQAHEQEEEKEQGGKAGTSCCRPKH